MKKTSSFLLVLAALTVWIPAAGGADLSAGTGFHYDWWEDTADSSGSQALIPFRVDARRGAFAAGLLTAYSYTKFRGAGDIDRSLTTLLDTKLFASYAIEKKLPVDILFGLDLNLPTGKTNLPSQDLLLLMDPELVSVNNFGEGFDVNPTVSIAKDWGDFSAGLGVGYAWRGKYDFSTQAGLTDYDPGDIVTLSALARYRFADRWIATLSGNAAWFRNQSTRGIDVYKEGDFFALGAALSRTGEKFTAGLAAKALFRAKSRYLQGTDGLSAEARNSHGDEWRAELSLGYRYDKRTSLGSRLQFLLVRANGYDPTSPRFEGERRKVALGIDLTHKLTESVDAGISATGFLMHDDDRNFPFPVSERTYRGASGTIHIGTAF